MVKQSATTIGARLRVSQPTRIKRAITIQFPTKPTQKTQPSSSSCVLCAFLTINTLNYSVMIRHMCCPQLPQVATACLFTMRLTHAPPMERLHARQQPTPSNPPYAPVYLFTISGGGATSAPSSVGPKIPIGEASDFTTLATQPVARMIVSNNTLQHFRGDASRRQSVRDGRKRLLFVLITRCNHATHNRFTRVIN